MQLELCNDVCWRGHRCDLLPDALRIDAEGRLVEQPPGRVFNGVVGRLLAHQGEPSPTGRANGGVSELVGRYLRQTELRQTGSERFEHHAGAGVGDDDRAARKQVTVSDEL